MHGYSEIAHADVVIPAAAMAAATVLATPVGFFRGMAPAANDIVAAADGLKSPKAVVAVVVLADSPTAGGAASTCC